MGLLFRRWFIVLAILVGGAYYLRTHYYLIDLLDYVRSNPDSIAALPMTDYYVGMSYYMREKYEPASRAFQQLLEDYPTSQYAEPALFRLGGSYEEMRNWKGAREAYEKYMEQFPAGKESALVHGKYDHIKFN